MSSKHRLLKKSSDIKVDVKQTRTSCLRMLKANPLIQYEVANAKSSPFKIHTLNKTNCLNLLQKSQVNYLKPNNNETTKFETPKKKKFFEIRRKRRSLSAQHYEKKMRREQCNQDLNETQSMEDLLEISCITEEKTTPIFTRKSIVFRTPISTSKRILFADRSSTPNLSEIKKMEQQLSRWVKKNKYTYGYNSLLNFGANTDESEKFVEAALRDLRELTLQGFPLEESENWLHIIKEKVEQLELKADFWQCRAAIEQMQGNISKALEYYQNAIIHGAEVKSIDKAIDELLSKWGVLETTNLDKTKCKVVHESRNAFITSIIQFAVQERKFKLKNTDEKPAPVREKKCTRLSRSRYVHRLEAPV